MVSTMQDAFPLTVSRRSCGIPRPCTTDVELSVFDGTSVRRTGPTVMWPAGSVRSPALSGPWG